MVTMYPAHAYNMTPKDRDPYKYVEVKYSVPESVKIAFEHWCKQNKERPDKAIRVYMESVIERARIDIQSIAETR